jgi:phage terminase large subunit
MRIPNNWKPRWYQVPLWKYLWNGGTRAIEIGHRRWGKDDVCLHWAAVSALKRPATYWHMLPEAAQARKAVWEAVNPHTGKRRIDEAFPPEIRTATRENEMLIKIRGGATWQVVGSDNFNSLVGSPPFGVVFSEWALADPQAWAYIRPILRENGGWALFITTPRGDNHAKAMLDSAMNRPGWYADVSPVTKTMILSPEDLKEELQEYIDDWGEDQGRALYEQEWLCSFRAAIIGAYYAHELRRIEERGQITNVPHIEGIPVDTWWDLGYDDSTSIWFTQTVGREIHIIEYYENNNQGLLHYGKVLKDRSINKNYMYGSHTGPHDTMKHELGPGKDLKQQAAELADPITGEDFSFVFNAAERIKTQQEGIQAVRSILPFCWFDRDGCTSTNRERKVGLPSLENYRNEWDEKHVTFKNTPLHDWASHGAKAYETMAITHQFRGSDNLSDIFG